MKQKRIIGLSGLLFAVCLLGEIFGGRLMADTGREAATRIERGQTLEVRTVSPSSATGTTLFPQSNKRPDAICFNNSPNTVWIGTVTTAVHGQEHTNISNGFPLKSSSTFSLDGAFRGTMQATCEATKADCELRCLDSLVP